MPTTQAKVTFPGVGGTTAAAIPADRGRLTAVSLLTGTSATKSADVYAAIGVTRSSGIGGVEVCILTSGYCGFLTPLTWTGDFNLETDMTIFIRARNFVADTFTFTIVTDVPS